MTVPVLTAVSDARWEADLVAALERADLGVSVARRCVDMADLLATATTGTARAAILSADLRRLDREALRRLAVSGVAVVALFAPGDDAAERRLRQLGVAAVLRADAEPQEVARAVLGAVRDTGRPSDPGLADPRASLPDQATAPEPPPEEPTGGDVAPGRLVAVWGPTGAPGRTTVAVGVAAELARLGQPALLVDADVYGGVVAQVLGLLDEAPGLAAAARLANNGSLDCPALAGLAREALPGLRVLTGISRADRWPELRPAAVETVLELARGLAATTVVDCGFALEQDEELAYDTVAPRRNGATLSVLAAADTVLAVGSADPVGLQRLIRGLADLREVTPAEPVVVVNRLRRHAVGGGDSEREVGQALQRYAGVPARFVPLDQRACDEAVAAGRTLAEVAPTSPARVALRRLAADLAGVEPPRSRRRGRRGRRAAAG